MDLQEMKDFMKKFEEVALVDKMAAIRFITGIALTVGNESFVTDIFTTKKGFDELYEELIKQVTECKYLNTEETLKRLEECKSIVKDAYTVYLYKTEASRVANPFELASVISSQENVGTPMFFLALLMMLGKNLGFNNAIG